MPYLAVAVLQARSQDEFRLKSLKAVKGQYLPKSDVCITSVQPPITDSSQTSRHFAFGPGSDICAAARNVFLNQLTSTRISFQVLQAKTEVDPAPYHLKVQVCPAVIGRKRRGLRRLGRERCGNDIDRVATT